MAIKINPDQLTEQGKENLHNWSEKGHFTDGKEQLKEEIMDCLKEKNNEELGEPNEKELKLTPAMIARLQQLAGLNAIYGGGHEFCPNDAVEQSFIPDLD